MKLLFSNLGYALGIDGRLVQHVRYLHRRLYTAPTVQRSILQQMRRMIERERPDLCCIVEIDQGSLQSAYFNQIEALMCEQYCYHDIALKYAEGHWLRRMPFHQGKSNAFLSRRDVTFKRHYLSHGSKRLLHEITLTSGLTLFFTHFSLQHAVRARQFQQVYDWMKQTDGEVILMGDFNIFTGMEELRPFLVDPELKLLNRPGEMTFRFSRRRRLLDVCIASHAVAEQADLQIIPQPYSDHAALLVDLVGSS